MITNLADMLSQQAQMRHEKLAYTFLVDGETKSVTLTYGVLDQRARAIAARLQSLGAFGKPVLLLYPPGLEFVCGFMGCMYSGAIAVPVPVPHTSRGFPRALGIARDAKPRVALTTESLLRVVKDTLADLSESLFCLASDILPSALSERWKTPGLTSDDLAFLQYTSGSTAEPRGVMVSHGNALHNLGLIKDCFGHTADSHGVIWLPPYHDMGLIGGILQPLYAGFSVTLMSPIAFLQRPVRWLQAISRFRAPTSGGPNFAYELCIEKVTSQQEAALDLSSWEMAFNGAEQIQTETVDRFCERFAPCGFRREAMYCCYGLAESTLMVSGGVRMMAPMVSKLDAAALREGHVTEGGTRSCGTRTLVSSGRALQGGKILIVDPERLTQSPADQVGEIWVSGPSVARGYWDRPVETEQTFRARLADGDDGPFLRTGDLGFLKDGNLFITGRLKDVIIIDGCNHYPQDIEFTVERACPFLDPGSVAAFAAEVEGREQLIVIAEARNRNRVKLETEDRHSIAIEIRRAVSQHHDLRVHDFLLLKPGSIPRTSSGKIQRYLCRTKYVEQNLVRAGD